MVRLLKFIFENFFALQTLPRFVARSKIIKNLKERGLLTDIRDHGMSIPVCSRTGDIIEPLPKPQWFLRYKYVPTCLIHVKIRFVFSPFREIF